MKKIISFILLGVMALSFGVGCGSNNGSDSGSNGGSESTLTPINVVSRESGSGTRGAFVEITGVLEKDGSGNSVDKTFDNAIIQNGTNAIITTVSNDKNAIGYISIGSLNDTIKALDVDGVSPTAENVQNGSYQIARPYNITFTDDISELAQDFVNYILSSDGQAVVVSSGYTQASNEETSYSPSNMSGIITVVGSTSVSPVMEKLAEAYMTLNPNVSIEIQSVGSSAGVQASIDKTADIGMASREIRDSESSQVSYLPIAIDGIAMIVNKDSQTSNITLEDIRLVYTGEKTNWEELN